MPNWDVLTEQQLDCFDTDGFVLVPDVLTAEEVATLQAGMWQHLPSPDQYFADPAALHPSDRQPVRRTEQLSMGVTGARTGWSPIRGSCRSFARSWASTTSGSTRASCGPSMPATPTTTSTTIAISATTRWWCPVFGAGGCRSPRSSTCAMSTRPTVPPRRCQSGSRRTSRWANAEPSPASCATARSWPAARPEPCSSIRPRSSIGEHR